MLLAAKASLNALLEPSVALVSLMAPGLATTLEMVPCLPTGRALGLLMAVQLELLPRRRDLGPTNLTRSTCCVEPAAPSLAATCCCSLLGSMNAIAGEEGGLVRVWRMVFGRVLNSAVGTLISREHQSLNTSDKYVSNDGRQAIK